MATNFASSTVAANDTITAAERNNLRKDVLVHAGDYEVSTGSANAYVLSIDAQITSYTDNLTVVFNANFTNTGAATINVNSIGANTIKTINGDDLEANAIRSGQVVVLKYDGTNFQLMSSSIIHGAKGDIEVATANGATEVLNVGGDNEVPIADPSASSGLRYGLVSRLVESATSDATVANTTTETAIFSETVLANTLDTNGVIAGRLYVSTFDFAAAGSCTIRLKLGGSTIATTGISSLSQTGLIGYIDFMVINAGSTSSQEGSFIVDVVTNSAGVYSSAGSTAFVRDSSNGTSAVDTTSDRTLELTAQWSIANASNSIVVRHGYAAIHANT